MSLLDAIKKQTKKENVVENHPVKKLEFEDKFNYLRGLALFSVIDENISREEKSLLKELIKIFNCEQFEDQFNEFLDKPDIGELDNIIKSINENNVSHLFILDALLVSYADSIYDKNEKELLQVFSKQLDITKSEIKLLEKFAKAVSAKNYQDSVTAFNEILSSLTSKIDITLLDCFLEEFNERKELTRTLREVEMSLIASEEHGRGWLKEYVATSFDCEETPYIYLLSKFQYDDKNEHKFMAIIQLYSPAKVLIQTRSVKYVLKAGDSGVQLNVPLRYKTIYVSALDPKVELGFGSSNVWKLGTYKVKVFIEGKFYLEKEFEVTA